jgi:hypothetical protein
LRDFFSQKCGYLYKITSKRAFYDNFSRSLTLSLLANHQLSIIVCLNIIAVHRQRAGTLPLRLPTLYLFIHASKERIGLRVAMPTNILEGAAKSMERFVINTFSVGRPLPGEFGRGCAPLRRFYEHDAREKLPQLAPRH